MKIAFLGFGEAARAFQESLAALDHSLEFVAYDILLESSGTAPAMQGEMEKRNVAVAADRTGLGDADRIFSAVTADQSLLAAQSLAQTLHTGQCFIDINSVSPERKRKTAALVEATGASYLDMAVMAPVHPRGHRTPVLIAGPAAAALVTELERLQFGYRIIGDEPGSATAIKMVRSLFVKGLEAITVEALLAAKASGCFGEIYQSLSSSYPGLDWPDFAAYEFERTLHHGKRRAAEMHESAATLAELGLNGALATEIANVQQKMGGLAAPAPQTGEMEDAVGKILAARLRT